MPELPEVERGRQLAERIVVGRRIERVRCADDRIVFDGATPRTFQRTLTGRRVIAVKRRGKQLWFELDERPWPLFHFGMTGGFFAPGEPAPKLRSTPRKNGDAAWPRGKLDRR